MSHTYAQNVIHVVFSAMDLLQVSPRFYLVIPLPDEGRKRGLFFRRRRTCFCSAHGRSTCHALFRTMITGSVAAGFFCRRNVAHEPDVRDQLGRDTPPAP